MFAIINRQAMELVCKTQLQPDTLPPLHLVLNLDESTCFNVLTTLEVKLLYRNTGQVMGTNLGSRDSVVSSIQKLLRHVPVRATDQQTLFDTSIREKATKIGIPKAGTGPDRTEAKVTTPARDGSVRSVIWAHADEKWENAGKPIDKSIVLALRKEMMSELEILGVKKTSSSNELGNWMKARIPA